MSLVIKFMKMKFNLRHMKSSSIRLHQDSQVLHLLNTRHQQHYFKNIPLLIVLIILSLSLSPTQLLSALLLLKTSLNPSLLTQKQLIVCVLLEAVVELPNGSLVTTNLAGTIHFDDNFLLANVFYIPHFTFNLIYVPKLTVSLDCHLIYDNANCFIQNTCSKRMIGAAE